MGCLFSTQEQQSAAFEFEIYGFPVHYYNMENAAETDIDSKSDL